MLRSLTGHGYGHDDRVLPLHLHHTGTYLRVLAWVRVGLPQNKVSLGGRGGQLLQDIQARLVS